MERRYTHLTIEERCDVARRHAAGASIRQIAAGLDRAPSTIARELKRNGSRTLGYQPRYAEQQARARRWRGPKLDRDPVLRAQVLGRLQQGWSPEQVAGRLARDAGRRVISHETIYRFIDAQIRRTKDYTWRHFLPQGRAKRGRRSRKALSPAAFMAHRRPLSERPAAAAARRAPGHWEADLMLFRLYGQAVLTLHERHSRLLLAVRPPGKAAAPIAQALTDLLAPLPPAWRQTVTFDNGTEFARALRPPCARDRDLLLRPVCPLAERRDRKRHRPPAPDSAAQDRPGHRARPPASPSWCRPTTTRHANASATRPRLRWWNHLLHLKCVHLPAFGG